MPNRIIKESIRTSKKLNSLSDFQFRLWTYLLTYVDDYGRGSADPELLKGFVFPRRKGVTESTIKAGLTDLANTGLIDLYEVDGESYLCFPTWAEHQRIQQKRSKFPAPTEGIITSQKSTVGHGDTPPESNPNPNPNPNPESEVGCAEPQAPSAPPAICFPLNDGSEYQISHEQVAEWVSLYPGTDVMQQLRSMLAWLNANPTRRKTKKDVKSFVVSWLNKEQNRGRGGQQYSYKNQNLKPSCAGSNDDRIKEDMERMSRLMAKMHEQEGA